VLSGVFVLALVALGTAGVVRAVRGESVPDPIATSVTSGLEHAFVSHRLVALTDPRTPALNRIVLSLVREPAFRARAHVIVYDCCAPRYQALVDRYVSGGDVSLAAVSRVWARAGPAIPRPNLFIEARKLNRRLPVARRIRVVLAHPWAPPLLVCKRAQRCLVWGDRLDRVVADVVEREVFRRGENALLLAGDWKLDRRRRPANPSGYGFDSAARRIERRHPGSLFLVWAQKVCPIATSSADEIVARWQPPAIADIRGTSVGLAPEALLWDCVKGSTLRGLPLARPTLNRHVEEDVDAILTVRPSS
jgi:hypothetical protein